MSEVFHKRIEKLRKMAEEYGVDAFFVSSEPNMRYFTGFSALAIERLAAVIIPTKAMKPVLIVPKLEEEKAVKLSFFKDIRSYTDAENPARLINEVIKEMNLTKATVGIESYLPFKFYSMLKEAAPSLEVKDVSEIFAKLRCVKSEDEVKFMKKAADITIKGIKAGMEAIKIGASELTVAFEIEREIKESGGESVPFCLVLSGENSALPHGITSNRKIKNGDAVVIDVGATYQGYYADITRTVFVGKASEEQKKIYDIVLKAQESAVNLVKPKIKACEVDAAARGVIEKAGYGKFFTHRTGHGLGLEVHEEPYITQTNAVELEPGMTFTVEPGIYIGGSFGVRIEDNIVVTAKDKEVLTKMSKDLTICAQR